MLERQAISVRMRRPIAGRSIPAHIFLLLVACSTCFLNGTRAIGQGADRALPTLVHADEIRRLRPEQASLGYPVRIRGVITMDAPEPDFFLLCHRFRCSVPVPGRFGNGFA